MEVVCTPKESAPSHPPGPRHLPDWLPAAVIVAAALLACIPAMRGGFLWDDGILVSDNPLVTAPGGLRRIWFSTKPAEYLPLTFTMHWLEWRLWGGRPIGHHVVNVLFHAAAAVLLWRVLARLRIPGPFDPAQRDRPEGNRMGGAWLAGLLFALHPVAVASAAWISERKNTLSMALYLLSLLMYLKFEDGAGDWEIGKLGGRKIGSPLRGCHSDPASAGEESYTETHEERPSRETLRFAQGDSVNLRVSASPRLRVYFASVVLFLLALLSKTSIVTLPVILLLCAWWRHGRISRSDILRSLPFFALSLALGLVTVWFQQHNAIHGGIVHPEGLAARVAGAGWIPWFYLFKIVLPTGLCAIYPRWNVPESALAFLPLLLLLGSVAFLWTRRNSWGRAPLFAAAYFLIALLPVLGLVNMSFMQHSFVADHLQYAAMIGVIAFAAGILCGTPAPARRQAGADTGSASIGCEMPSRGRLGHISPNRVFLAAGCAAVLGVLTWNRASLYGAEERLWRENVAENPASWAAWNEVGNADSAAGAYGEATRCFDKAIALKPDCFQAWSNRGLAYDRMGQLARAFGDYDRALKLNPRYAEAYNNRGLAHDGRGERDLAILDYNRAIQLKPRYADAYYNLGRALAASNRIPEAINDYTLAISLKPRYAEAYNNRGAAYAASNRPDEAIKDYSRAIALKPDYAEAYNNRGVACTGCGCHEQAFRDYDRAIELKPDFVLAFYNRANAEFRAGRMDPALRDYDRAIQLKPDYADAWCSRARVFLRTGRFAAAISDCDRAIALKLDYADAYYNRAVGHYYLKEYDKALADVATCRKFGGRPDAGFLKDLSEAAGKSGK